MKQFGRKKRTNWLSKHLKDEFVQKANEEGYRSRASYKLLEIQSKDKLLKPGMRVVDLGAAPGSWSQVTKKFVGEKGVVVALDLLPVNPIDGVTRIQGDFRDPKVNVQLHEALGDEKIDLVLSDIAPNLTGIKAADQANSVELSELVLDFAVKKLRKNGSMLVKVFHGTGFDEYRKLLEQYFTKVHSRKPAASRDASRETYLLATGYKF